LTFIEEFPQTFRAKREDHNRKQGRIAPDPQLWKMLGDELLFLVEPERMQDVTALIETFHAALIETNTRTRETIGGGLRSDRLKVKGAAWIAGFPVTNAVVCIEGNEDYVGPSMDAGFRIGKLATSRRLAVSADLAWLLTHLESRSNLVLHFEGCAELKGVAEEVGYPAIWIETPSSAYKKIEDQLLGRTAQEKKPDVHRLCTAFIQEYGVPNYLPFFPGDGDITSPPADYDNRYGKAVEGLRRLYLVDDPSATPTLSDDQAEKAAESLLSELPDQAP